MSGRPILSILLVAAVILCPLRCKLPVVAANDTGVPVACCPHHCGQATIPGTDADSTDSRLPPADPANCECCNCLCAGALRIVEFDVAIVTQFENGCVWSVLTSYGEQPAFPSTFWNDLSVLPGSLPGHNLRAALSSWTL